MTSRLRALRVVHPFPSFLNSALVLGLALIAGAPLPRAALLAVGMLGLQFAIGATNDVVDLPRDIGAKPWKPLVAGALRLPTARGVALLAAVLGLASAALAGPLPLMLAAAMLGCGLAYDFVLKPTPFAWACFSVAFALLPVYAWYGAAGTFLPRPELVLPLAAISGPQLELANGLVDLQDDQRSGVRSLAVRLGRVRSLGAICVLTALVHAVAWVTLGDGRGGPLLAVATASALVGVACLAQASGPVRQVGWVLQTTSLAVLGLGWLWAVA